MDEKRTPDEPAKQGDQERGSTYQPGQGGKGGSGYQPGQSEMAGGQTSRPAEGGTQDPGGNTGSDRGTDASES